MGIAIGLVLILIGLFCVADTTALPAAVLDNVSGDTLGWILVVLGVLALVSFPATPSRARQQELDDQRPQVPRPRLESRAPQPSNRRPPLS